MQTLLITLFKIPFSMRGWSNMQSIYLNTRNRTDVKSSNAILNLALKLGWCLSHMKELRIYVIRSGLNGNFTDVNLSKMCPSTKKWKIRTNQKVKQVGLVYWENAFKTFDLRVWLSKVPKQQLIDVYWRKIGAIKMNLVS